MSHWSEKPGDVPDEDRKQFIRENAVALVEEKEALIARLRSELTRQHKADRSRRKEIERLQSAVTAAIETCAKIAETGLDAEVSAEEIRRFGADLAKAHS